MSRAQYKRLLAVVLIPLLFLGLWLKNNEVLFGTNFLLNCYENGDQFSCKPLMLSREEMMSRHYENHGLYLGSYIYVSNGFSKKVVMLSRQEREASDLPPLEHSGTEKTGTVIALKVGQYEPLGANTSCTLGPLVQKRLADTWLLTCDGMSDWIAFRFADPEVGATYDRMMKSAVAEHERLLPLSIVAATAELVIPLIGFLLISVSIYLLLRLTTFIRYGRAQSASKDAGI